MPTPSRAAAADPRHDDRTIIRPPGDNPSDLALIHQLALASGEPEAVVMQNLLITDGRLAWTPRFAVARVNRSGLITGRVRWTDAPQGAPQAVTAAATLSADGTEVRCTVTLEAALEDGRVAFDAPAEETHDRLHWLAAARLIDRYFPDLLLALPVAERDPAPLPHTPHQDAPESPVERVVYDEFGNADLRRPTSAERLLERVERHLERAAHPERILDLNAAALTAAVAELDDGPQRIAALWRRHGARIDPAKP